MSDAQSDTDDLHRYSFSEGIRLAQSFPALRLAILHALGARTQGNELMTVSEVCQVYRVSHRTVRSDCDHKRLPCCRRPYGNKYKILIKRADAERVYYQQHSVR